MKKRIRVLICIMLAASLFIQYPVYAWEGDCGYEGGISSGAVPGIIPQDYQYQEVCFITGKPIVMKGTLKLTKSPKQNSATKQDVITATYAYNLSNADEKATLTRTLVYTTTISKEDNGQKTEKTIMARKPVETVKIGNDTFTLTSYNGFSRSNIIDPKPAINYYMGVILGTKIYRLGAGTATGGNTGTVTVDVSGNYYGYEQYWGTTEMEKIRFRVQSDIKRGANTDSWSGICNISWSYTTIKELKYVKNAPEQSSFEGGYVQQQKNSSILEYTTDMPEFDSKGISTDKTVSQKGSLKLETASDVTNLPISDLSHLRGHWAEKDIKELYSLKIFKGNETIIDPEEYMQRSEFVSALIEAAKEVPVDPSLLSKTKTSTKAKNTKIVSPFDDVDIEHLFFGQINNALNRGIAVGKSANRFVPDDIITLSEAVTMMINSVGLHNLAPNPSPVTTFKDNDQIPPFSRNAFYTAERIGLIKEDSKGFIYPNAKLTRGRVAAMLNSYIAYMKEGIRKEYTQGMVNF